jgi:2-polyprenyl-6-methoxyphenol hydroxylase-like FAD-dependent oxidoreductase
MQQSDRKIVILGGGPCGIEAALYAQTIGYQPTVYESAAEVGGNLTRWGFVRLFTPWRSIVSATGLAALKRLGLELPDLDSCPTGQEFVEAYLRPLAQCLQVHRGCKVVAVSRRGLLKSDLGSAKRSLRPFRLLLERNGREMEDDAQIVIDASGVYGSPCFVGDGGIPAIGERAASSTQRVRYHIPDILGSDRAHYAGRRVLLVGGGFSAATALRSLAVLTRSDPSTQVVWATRTDSPQPLPLFEDDPLRERRALADEANAIAAAPPVGWRVVSGVVVRSIAAAAADAPLQVELRGVHDERLDVVHVDSVIDDERLDVVHVDSVHDELLDVVHVDSVLALVGFKPDLEMTRELQVHQCYATEGPMKLAALISGSADCLRQRAHASEMLLNPEPGFFVIGSKSYGRSSNFLLSIGIEQVRSVFELINAQP